MVQDLAFANILKLMKGRDKWRYRIEISICQFIPLNTLNCFGARLHQKPGTHHILEVRLIDKALRTVLGFVYVLELFVLRFFLLYLLPAGVQLLHNGIHILCKRLVLLFHRLILCVLSKRF